MANDTLINRLFNSKTNIGIGLCLVGVPLGMFFNFLFPIVEWSPIFMFFSVIFVANFSNLLNLKFPSWNDKFLAILAFQVLMLLYGMFSPRMNFQFFSFHVYIITLLFAFASCDLKSLTTNLFLVIFSISGIVTVLGSFFTWNGMISGQEAWELRQEDENYALEAFTTAGGALVNFTVALFLLNNKKWYKFLVFLFLILDIYIMFSSKKRTPIFVMLSISALYFYKIRVISRIDILQYIKVLSLAFVLLVVSYLFVPFVTESVDNFFINFFNGVANMFGNLEVSDKSGSAVARYEARNWAFDYIEKNFGVWNFIFGAGYMKRWLDNPLLQSFVDMGIIGFLFYAFFTFILPLKTILLSRNKIVYFFSLLCLYNILSNISSGHPYAYIKYVPVVLLCFILELEQKWKFQSNRLR